MENKICPLLSITGGLPTECKGDRCAWYVPTVLSKSGAVLIKGHCAAQDIGALPALVSEVKAVSYYRICPDCGVNLDPGEICDCQDKKETALGVSSTQSGTAKQKVSETDCFASSVPENKEESQV